MAGIKMRKNEQWEYRCIDGNWTKRPAAYCTYHHGVLTSALMKVHRCRERECQRLMTLEEAEQRAAEREKQKEGEKIADNGRNQDFS